MKGVLHVIVGTPDSNRRSTLAHAINPTDKKPSSHFLFPHELESTEFPVSHWEWIDHGFEIKNLEEENINEWFLFFSNQIDLADQFESLQEFVDQEEELEIGRIITFINAEYLNMKASSVRLFFIYSSFLTLGSPLLAYFIMVFVLRLKELVNSKRTSVFDL